MGLLGQAGSNPGASFAGTAVQYVGTAVQYAGTAVQYAGTAVQYAGTAGQNIQNIQINNNINDIHKTMIFRI